MPSSVSLDEVITLLKQNNEQTHQQMEDMKALMRDEAKNSRVSRAAIHRRMDEQNEQINHLEKTVAIAGQVDAQTRDRIAALELSLKDSNDAAQPFIEDMKRMKALGWTISGLIALAGLTFGAILAYANDVARALFKQWLG